MKEIKNIILIGLGAIGTIYATKLQDYDATCLKVLVDEERFDRYSKNSIYFNDKRYDFNYIKDTEKSEADLIIIATKANGFEKATEMMKNFVGPETIILSLLNGIHSEEILKEKYKNVLCSFFLGHSSMREGTKVEQDGVGKIFFGEEDQEISQNVLLVKDLFEKAKIDYEIVEDIKSALWQKFVINIGVNQTCAYKKAPFKILHTQEGRTLAEKLMQEAVEIAKKIKIEDAENFINQAFEYIDSQPLEFKPSMLQDVEKNKPTEVDIFAGEVSRLGKKLGIKTPNNDFILKFL